MITSQRDRLAPRGNLNAVDDFPRLAAIQIIGATSSREEINQPPNPATPEGQVLQNTQGNISEPKTIVAQDSQNNDGAAVFFIRGVLLIKNHSLGVREWLGHFGEFESIEFGHKIYFLTEAIVI